MSTTHRDTSSQISRPLPGQRPPNRRSPTSSTPPSRAIPSQHHRQSSGSALTIQTQLPNYHLPTSQQGSQEYTNNPRFSYLFNSVLGSPFLTTSDIALPPSSYGLENNGGENRYPPRQPSPTPTADYSIIDADELEADILPVFCIPGGYPRPHQRSMSFGINSHATWPNQRRHTYDTGSGLNGSSFLSLNHPTESISMPNMPQPSNPFKSLLPRILDALSSPSKTFAGNYNSNSSPSSSSTSTSSSPAGSPGIFSHSISLPTGYLNNQSTSGRQSPLLWGAQSTNNRKGKGPSQPSHYFSFSSELVEDLDYSELSPLDGEEGELIDEACFVDIRAITGVDILALLPTELALYILQLICPPPASCNGSSHGCMLDSNPLSDAVEEQSKDAFSSLLACTAVSHTWRRLANDNSVWQALFLGRWGIDLRKADASYTRKLVSPSLYGSPPPQLRKRHRWKLKTKSQLGSGSSSESRILPSSTTNSRTTSRRLVATKMCHPKQKFPLQFDWKRMYIERLQLERRWTGAAFVRVPVTPTEDPSMIRESRSFTNRKNARSRSLSPSGLLGFGDNALRPSASGHAVDRLFDTSTIGRRAVSTKSSRSGSMPASAAALFKEQKWEPKTMELRGHSDRYVVFSFSSYAVNI